MFDLYLPMFVMFGVALVICAGMYAAGTFLGPKNPTPDKVMPFEQARPAVEKALRESERRQRQEAYLVELRKAARIERPTPKP